MRITRRRMIAGTGGVLIAALAPRGFARADDIVDIVMRGNADGSRVWFDPIGIRVRPGQTIRWTNRDGGNSHTATAYDPANDGHPRRIPKNASPWNSDYLLPDQSFSVVLTLPGVYDFFCVPHELAGMVGRIIVAGESQPAPPPLGGIPEIAEKAFPKVEDIVRMGRVVKG